MSLEELTRTYPTDDDLRVAVLLRELSYWAIVVSHIARDVDGYPRLRNVDEETLRLFLAPPDFCIGPVAWTQVLARHELTARIAKPLRELAGEARWAIHKSQGSGPNRPGWDEALDLLLALFAGLALRYQRQEPPWPLTTLFVRKVVRLLLSPPGARNTDSTLSLPRQPSSTAAPSVKARTKGST